jgi:hypothetical protein
MNHGEQNHQFEFAQVASFRHWSQHYFINSEEIKPNLSKARMNVNVQGTL